MHPDWNTILEASRSIPPESEAWDGLAEAVAQLRELAEQKLAQRRDHLEQLRQEFAAFAQMHASFRDAARLPGWLFDGKVPELNKQQAADASRKLQTLAAAMEGCAAAEAETASVASPGRAASLRRQADALDEETRCVAELAAALGYGLNDVAMPLAESKPGSAAPPDAGEEAIKNNPLPDERLSSPMQPPRRRDEGPKVAPLDGPILALAPEDEPAPPHAPASVVASRASDLPPQPPVAVALDVPIALSSYDDFRDKHWIRPDGECAPGPWLDGQFAGRLAEVAQAALADLDFARLLVFGEAAVASGLPPTMESEEVESFAALWSEPASPVSGVAPGRAERLRGAIESGEGGESRWQIAAFLEALRPSLEQPLSPAQVHSEILFESEALRDAVPALLRLHQGGTHPIERLKAEITRTAAPSRTELAARLRKERAAFRETVRELWSAADGRVQHSHCRRAWRRFIEEAVEPLAATLR